MSAMRHSLAMSNLKLFCESAEDDSCRNTPANPAIVDYVDPSHADATEAACRCVSVCVDGFPLAESAVTTLYDPARFARRSNDALDSAIVSVWRRRCRANPRLYNASKFRLAGLECQLNASPDNNDDDGRSTLMSHVPQSSTPSGGVVLKLGLTCYRDHVATNCAGRLGGRLLQRAGSVVCGDRQAFLADCLAVGAALLTADNRLVLLRRAGWTGEYPNRLDRPGGHAEPHQLLVDAKLAESFKYKNQDKEKESHEEEQWRNPLLLQLSDADVHSEVFGCVLREIRDEVGVPLLHLSQPLMLGLTQDPNHAGRPTLEFVIRCSLPSSDLLRIYQEGRHTEADESTSLVMLHLDDVLGELTDEAAFYLDRISVMRVGDQCSTVDVIEASMTEDGQAENANVEDNISSDSSSNTSCRAGIVSALASSQITGEMPANRVRESDSVCEMTAVEDNEYGVNQDRLAISRLDGNSHDSGCGVSTKLSPENQADGRASTDGGGRIAVSVEVTQQGAVTAARCPVSEAHARRQQARQLWRQMTPACHASIALLRTLKLSAVGFKF